MNASKASAPADAASDMAVKTSTYAATRAYCVICCDKDRYAFGRPHRWVRDNRSVSRGKGG